MLGNIVMEYIYIYIYNIMNAKCERESDPENFGARITEFEVVVGKI
jgi:hypothetical protein